MAGAMDSPGGLIGMGVAVSRRQSGGGTDPALASAWARVRRPALCAALTLLLGAVAFARQVEPDAPPVEYDHAAPTVDPQPDGELETVEAPTVEVRIQPELVEVPARPR